MSTTELHHGDCLEVLASMDSDSVAAIVTDPPYGLSFMGRKWDYDVPSVAIWEQCLRVLKPGGYLLAFAGTRTQHRMCVNIEDAGFEIRDMIAWVYGEGFPKGKSCLKPALEPITMARKQAKHVQPLNIDGCRIKPTSAPRGREWEEQRNRVFLSAAIAVLSDKLTELESSRSIAEERAGLTTNEKESQSRLNTSKLGTGCSDGTKAGNTFTNLNTAEFGRMPTAQSLTDIASIIETASKPTIDWTTWNSCQSVTTSVITSESISAAMKSLKHAAFNNSSAGNDGRWPANLIHDGSDEVTQLFPESKGQQGAVTGAELSNKTANAFGEFSKRSAFAPRNDSGSAARFFYTAKASKDDRDKGNTHPCVKPTDLMAYLCRLVTPPGGIVLDPFMGSGTTGKAALSEGFSFIGIERDPEYYAICESRFNGAQIGLALAV